MLLKTTFILFLVYFTAIEGLYERRRYPSYKFREALTGWTSLHEVPADWETASKNCQDEEATLISSWSNELKTHLIEIAKESNETIDTLFIGAKYNYPGGSYHNLEDVNKDNKKEDQCQIFYVNNGTMFRKDCTDKYPYICFAPAPPVDCDTIEFGQDRVGWPGYNRCSKVKGWLKLHVGPSNYDTARAKCESEGAQLLNPYIPVFKEQAMKLFKANSTEEEPILAVYSLAKVIHPQGVFEKVDGKLVWVTKNRNYCVIFTPSGDNISRTECEAKLSFICYARNPEAVDLFGPQLADTPELLTAPDGLELPYFNTDI